MLKFELWMAVIHIILGIVPFSILRYYPFLNKLRVRQSVFWVLYGSLVGLEVGWYVGILKYGEVFCVDSYEKLMMIFYVVYFLFSCIVIKEQLVRHLFVWLVCMLFSPMTIILGAYLESVIPCQVPYLVLNTAQLILIPIFMLLCFIFLKKIIIPLIRESSDGFCRMYAMVLFVMAFTPAKNLPAQENIPIGWIVVRILVCIGGIVVCFVFKNLLDEQKKVLALSQEQSHQEKLLALSSQEFMALSDRIEETKRARHDLKHHLAAIQTYLGQKDYEGLGNYIIQTQQILPNDAVFVFCKHHTVNMILSYYANKARILHIPIEISANVPGVLSVKDTELWVILGNLLENAIEGSLRIIRDEQCIRVKIAQKGGTLAVAIDNRCEESSIQKAENGKYLSSKGTENSGNGLTSVRLLAEKKGGSASFEIKDGWAFASVMV